MNRAVLDAELLLDALVLDLPRLLVALDDYFAVEDARHVDVVLVIFLERRESLSDLVMLVEPLRKRSLNLFR